MSELENLNKGESLPRKSPPLSYHKFRIAIVRNIRAHLFFNFLSARLLPVFAAFESRVFVPEIRDTVTAAPYSSPYICNRHLKSPCTTFSKNAFNLVTSDVPSSVRAVTRVTRAVTCDVPERKTVAPDLRHGDPSLRGGGAGIAKMHGNQTSNAFTRSVQIYPRAVVSRQALKAEDDELYARNSTPSRFLSFRADACDAPTLASYKCSFLFLPLLSFLSFSSPFSCIVASRNEEAEQSDNTARSQRNA